MESQTSIHQDKGASSPEELLVSGFWPGGSPTPQRPGESASLLYCFPLLQMKVLVTADMTVTKCSTQQSSAAGV